jgi:peptidoglycan hydrolase CwlO-like protein
MANLSIFTLFTLCLLLSMTNSIVLHRQTTQAKQDQKYLNALTLEETDLQKQLADLKSKIKFLNVTLDQIKAQPDKQIITLEETLAD